MASSTSTKKEGLLIFLFSVIGVAIAVFSFLLFHHTDSILLTVGICALDVIYSYWNARLFFKSKHWNGLRLILIPLMMIAYWSIIFGVVCFGNAILFDGVFSNRMFLYPVFLMPAFVFECLLLCLIVMGL